MLGKRGLAVKLGPALALAVSVGAGGCDRGGAPPAVVEGQAQAAAAPAAPARLDLEGHRTVYDLVANRVHALVHLGGHLDLAAGDPAFLKFVDGGWKSSWILGEKDGGKPVAFVSGLSASFFAPIDADGDGVGGKALADVKLRLTMRGLAPKQRVSIFANEKPVGTLDVGPDLQAHEVTVPAASLVLGENRFRLTFRAAAPIAGGKRSAAAIARITLGPADAPPAANGPTLGAGGAVALPGPSRLSYYVQVPAGARLVARHAGAAPGATVAVRVARDGAAPVTLHEGPAGGEGAWDLAAHAGQAVRIDLVSRGGGVTWTAPRLMVKAATAPPPAAAKFERIYVWMVDTLRADKLRIYNPKTRVETPNYDAFAKAATLFQWAHVPGTWSMPSHASILTGVYPTVHRAIAHEARLARDVPFIAELLKKAGYRTALFSSNGYVSGKWGFDRGWDHSRNFIRESLPNGADYLWKTAKEWVKQNDGKPQFIYLATVEPHVIYNPKKEFLARYWDKPYKGPIKPTMTGIQLGHIKSGKLKPTDVDKAYLEALYDAEVTQSDHEFGKFLADLKAQGVYDKSAVVVVSDHGDEFWEHGDVGHAQGVHQELVRIPLIIRAPGAFPAGKVVAADVEAMDVAPTLLALAGLPPRPDMQGTSLLPLAHDELAHSPRVAMSQNQAVTRGIKVGRYRFIHSGAARISMYDQIEDPREQTDVAGKRVIALRAMRNVFALLVAFESRWKKQEWGTAANVAEAFYSSVGS